MPTGILKPLTRGKCLEDLKPEFDFDVNADPKKLCRAAPKILKAAENSRLQGDEETSYILYMRFLSVVQRVRGLKKKDGNARMHCEEFSNSEVKEALSYAEKLATSLQQRYKQLQQVEQATHLDKKLKEKEENEKKKIEESVKSAPSDIVNGYADASGKFISCSTLRSLLDKKGNILIMDIRSADSYLKSCIKTDRVINVPESIIIRGISAATLEKSLSVESRGLWRQRGSVDVVVLVDWSSSSKNLKPQSAISVLRDILLEWDTEVSYKTNPLILDGGYEGWLLTYPVYTTNPQPTDIPSFDSLIDAVFLDNIEYPTLSESPESIHPSFDRSSKPKGIGFHESGSPTAPPSASVVSPSILPFAPQIMQPKPSSLAPSNSLSSSNSLTPSSSLASSKGYTSSTSSRPSIDRKSKAAALQAYEERSRVVQKLLKQKEEVTEETLKLEQHRQRMEEEVRLCRVKEAEEEMRLQLQEREEKLMRDIIELERIQAIKDQENQRLRDELEEYKRREKEPEDYSPYKQQEDAINARIRRSEEQRKKILEERERRNQESIGAKKLGMGEGSNINQPSPESVLAFKEQERLAREKLQRDRILKEKQKQEEQAHNEKIPDKEKRPEEKRRPLDGVSESDQSIKSRINGKAVTKVPDRGTYTAPLKDTPSGIMKRSHSSPNIAQLDDDDLSGRGKPFKHIHQSEFHNSRKRNFSPIYGDMGRGLTGLKNLGNTCYMNSIIQCLSNTTPLARYFVTAQYRNDINRHNETHGEIAEEVAAVIRALWSSSYKCIATRDLRITVGKYREQFQTNQQQDSNEFLTILMDWLHEDLKKPSTKAIYDTGRELPDWEKQWEEFYKENTSLIVLLFYGQQKSTVQCLRCHEKSVRYETFSNLTLPLPCNSNSCTLEECVQLYVKGEHITGWKCPECKEPRDAIKKFDIIKLPPILIIHFKRFYIDGWCRKRQTFVRFPLKDWNMRKFTLFPNQQYTNYDLYGVSNHYGTMEGGHYTAYCKSVEHKKWYKFDDNEVNEISSSEVQSGAAYILFYASIDLHIPDMS